MQPGSDEPLDIFRGSKYSLDMTRLTKLKVAVKRPIIEALGDLLVTKQRVQEEKRQTKFR